MSIHSRSLYGNAEPALPARLRESSPMETEGIIEESLH